MKKNKVKSSKLKFLNCSLAKAIYSLLGTLGLYFIIKSSISDFQLIANLSIVPAFILLIYYWLKIAKLDSKSRITFHIIFSLFLSFVFIIGGQLNLHSQIFWSLSSIVKIFLGSFTIFPLLEIFNYLISDKIFQPNFTVSRAFKIIAFVVPFIVCVIVWIIFFPGVYTYDMAAWNEHLTNGSLSSHWSITYGYFLKIFLDSGYALFGNYEAGFAVSMFIQLIFICYVIYKIIIFAASQTKNKAMYSIALLFFILTPFIATMSITDAQDTAFGGFFALLILELYSIIHEPKYFKKKRNIIKFILFGFILLTLRNNGIICLLLLALFVAFVKIPNKKPLLLSLLGILLLNFIYTGPFFHILNVEKNATVVREILGVPSQQIARSYFENPSSFNAGNIEQLYRFYYLEEPELSSYKFADYQKYPLISDFTKGALNLDYVNGHLPEYLVFWAKMGIKNPGNYTEAFLLNSMGFWYPMKNYNDPRIKLGYMNYSGFAMTTATNNMKPVERLLPDNDVTDNLDDIIFSNEWYNIPIVAQLSSIGLYSIIFLYTIGLLIRTKSYKLLTTLSPALGLFATLLVAPVAIYRYAFPMALLIPVFICFMIIAKHNKKTT